MQRVARRRVSKVQRLKYTAAILIGGLLVGGAGLRTWRGAEEGSTSPDVFVARARLSVRLVETGTFRAASAITYRSPVEGRELAITFLAPEGVTVQDGDLVVKLDTSPL